MREVVFVDGMRTAFGKRGGTLKEFSGSQLAIIMQNSNLVLPSILIK